MPVDLLKTCWNKGIKLTVIDGNLSFKAAEGAMTEDVLSAIKANKAELIELIKQQPDYYDARPLSANERALWFLYRLKPESVAYNMVYAIKLKTYYSHEKIQQAFNKLCQAYPILVLNYGERDGVPVQWLTNTKPVVVELFEKHQLSSQAIEQWLQQQADIQLLPDNNKTCHIALLHDHRQSVSKQVDHQTNDKINTNDTNANTNTTDNVECYLTMVIHHIASDFISFEILRRDFMRLLNDQPVSIRQYPQHNYQTWTQKQSNHQSSDAEKYWIDSLQNLPQLVLPTDHHYQDNLPAAGAEIQQAISLELAQEIRQYCKDKHITHYVWWLGAFQWFMSRLSGQDKFIIGTPSAGRLTPEDNELVGYLVNPIALYCDVDNQQNFNDWLENVKTQTQQMLRYQAYPFAKLIDKLKVDRTSGRSPVFQHMFTLNNLSENNLVDTLVENELLVEQRGAAHELNLVVVDERGSFTCKWRYNNGLYNEQTVKNIQKMFEHWVLQLIENAKQPLTQLTTSPRFLSATAQGPRVKPLAASAWHSFEKQVEQYPQHIAINQKTLSFNYSDFRQLIEQTSQQFANNGFGQGDRLGIYLPRSIQQIVAMFASWRLGGSFLILDSQWPLSRIDYIVKDAKLKLLITDEQGLDNQKLYSWQHAVKWLAVEQDLFEENNVSLSAKVKSTNLPIINHSADDEAYLIYTSGSTGQPKAVIISQANLINYVTGFDHLVQLSANATMTSLSKHSADLGYTALFGALLTGRQFTLLDESLALNSQALLQELKNNPVDCLKIVPSHLNGLLLAESNGALLPKQALIFGGEVLSAQVIDNVRHYIEKYRNENSESCESNQVTLYNHYGPTEATIGSLVYRISDSDNPDSDSTDSNSADSDKYNIPLGIPLANLEIKVVDKSGHIQAKNLPGELHIAGDNIAQGYLNQAQLTQEKFYPSENKIWYRTGDNVRLIQDKIYYIGRSDDQIKIRGYRVELGEIQSWLNQYIDGVVVINQPDINQTTNEGHAQLIAYVVTDEKKLTDTKRLCQQALPEYMQPAQWIRLKKLPRLANGKIDKKALQTLVSSLDVTEEKSTGYILTNLTETEKNLLDIWKILLNNSTLTVYDNFFSVGGDSIIGLQVIAKARAKQITIKPQQLFQYKTIKALASALQPACSAQEQVLLNIVRTLLNNPKITTQDDFFAVGGDSILSLQLVAKARQADIQLRPKDIFSHKSIKNLVIALDLEQQKNKIAAKAKSIAINRQAFSQKFFPITPIQAWFFEQHLTLPAYWNQSVLLNTNTELNISALTSATEQLLKTHASLRLAFSHVNGVWLQQYQEFQTSWLANAVQVSDQMPNEETLSVYQNQFDLVQSPLVRFVYFSKTKTLLCTAHHLIVDAVSWQIIIEDLLSIYHAKCKGKSIHLAPVYTEFHQWQNYLQKLIDQDDLETHKDYWLKQLMPTAQQLSIVDNRYDDSVHHVTSFDLATTTNLLQHANNAYHTRPQELLITALTKTLAVHWQLTELTIELEGHGRESELLDPSLHDSSLLNSKLIKSTLSNAVELDLSRTIGWFTSRFPQKFTIADTLENTIVAHKEQLRNIPHKGLSYGLLRYMHPTFKQQPWGQSNLVSFNFLGTQKTEIDNTFNLNKGLAIATRAGKNQRTHLLDINAMVYNGQLHIDWCYAKSHPTFSNFEKLTQDFTRQLMEIITHCIDPKHGRATAADFPLANINDKAFVALLTELSQLSELSQKKSETPYANSH